MIKKLVFLPILILFLCSFSNGQNIKYAWIISPGIGRAGADTVLSNIIASINSDTSLEFAIVSGNLTTHGYNKELEQVKSMLDKLSIPYKVIPGENDLRWSESAGGKINSVFGSKHFMIKNQNRTYIGLNNSVIWRNGVGHFSPEELSWLSDTLKSIPQNNEIFLYSYFPFDSKTDNWFKLTNRLTNYKVAAIFSANGKPETISSRYMVQTIVGINSYDTKHWNYNIIENKNDSLFFYEIKDGISKQWGTLKEQPVNFSTIDTAQFQNKPEVAGRNIPTLEATELWQQDIGSTMLSDLVSNGPNVIATTENGKIFCYDTTGRKVWEYDSKETIVGRPAIGGNTLVVATLQGDLISLNSRTGKLIQVIGIGEPLTSQLITTRVEYNGNMTTGVIVGTSTGSLYCYSLDTFEMIWENHSAKGLIRTLPLIKEHRLFYGSQDGYLYCIDERTGILYWKWNEGNDFYTAPVVCPPLSDGEAVYISTPDKYVSKIDFLLGITKWRKKLQSWESIALSNNKKSLIVKSISNNIIFASTKNGKKEKVVNLKYGFDLDPTQPLEWKGNYLIATENGTVYLIDKNYKSKPLLFLGNCRLNSVISIKDNIFAISNMDGKIICFKLE